MKLTDIKKNADAKAAEVEAACKHAQLMKELEVHPLLKWGCDRSVRDAYFCGIVFAAMTDDAEIDDKERKVIVRIGHSLGLSQTEIDEFVETVSMTVKAAIGAGGGDVFALLEESAVALDNENVYRLFVAEYVKVCAVKDVDAKDVESQLQNHVALKSGQSIDRFIVNQILLAVADKGQVAPSVLLALSEWLGGDVCRYFMLDFCGDILDVVVKERERLIALKKKQARVAKECAARDKMREDCENWLNGIADEYDLKKIPKGVPARLSRQADRFDVGQLDLEDIKKKIVAKCRKDQRRMAWKLLGYFALQFKLTDECSLVRSVEYLMKTVFSHDSSIWGGGYSGKDVVQAFRDCIAKYEE